MAKYSLQKLHNNPSGNKTPSDVFTFGPRSMMDRFEKWLYSPGKSVPKIIVKGLLILIALLVAGWVVILYAPAPFGGGWGS